MREDILSLLKIHDYFQGLDEEILADVAGHMEVGYYDVGDCVHEANEPITFVGFLARGRVKAVVVDPDGNEKLFRYFTRGEQMGMISGALAEPVPIRLIAVEPLTLLRVDYEVGLELTFKHPELRRRWRESLARILRKTLLGEVQARKTKVLMIFHESPHSRPLLKQLVDRFCALGEKPGVFSDHPDFVPPGDVPFRPLLEAGRYLSSEQVRHQVSLWPQCTRLIYDVAGGADVDQDALRVEAGEQVLWCVTPETRESALGHLKNLVARAPAYREKISLVWCLKDSQIAPALPGTHELTVREFTVTSVPVRPPLGVAVANGLERLVHYLRGVQIGLALGGGAARGMAHLGVLKALEESGIVIDMIAGTSAGAMTGVLYAAGLDADYLAERFVKDLQPSWIFRCLPSGGYWHLAYNYRRGRFDPLLREYLGDWQLEQLPIPCSAVTVDLVRGKALVRDRGGAVEAILDSINLPVLARPICRPGQALIDGGFLNNVPADVLVSKGCNFVIAVDVMARIQEQFGTINTTTPAGKAKAPSILETVLRTYAVQSHNMTAIGERAADVKIEVDVSTFDMADFTRAVEAAAVGKQDTLKQLPCVKKLLHRLDGQLFS